MHNMVSFYKALAKKICQGTEYIRKAMRTRWLVWQSATMKDLKLNLHTEYLARKEYDQEEHGKTEYWEAVGVGVSAYWGGSTGAVNVFPPRISHYLPRFQFFSLHQRIKFILEILVKTWTNHNVKTVLTGAVRWEVSRRVPTSDSLCHLDSPLFYSHIPSHNQTLEKGCSEALWFLISKLEQCVGVWCQAQKLVTPSTQL